MKKNIVSLIVVILLCQNTAYGISSLRPPLQFNKLFKESQGGGNPETADKSTTGNEDSVSAVGAVDEVTEIATRLGVEKAHILTLSRRYSLHPSIVGECIIAAREHESSDVHVIRWLNALQRTNPRTAPVDLAIVLAELLETHRSLFREPERVDRIGFNIVLKIYEATGSSLDETSEILQIISEQNRGKRKDFHAIAYEALRVFEEHNSVDAVRDYFARRLTRIAWAPFDPDDPADKSTTGNEDSVIKGLPSTLTRSVTYQTRIGL